MRVQNVDESREDEHIRSFDGKEQKSRSRQRYIQASTPVGRVNLQQQNRKMTASSELNTSDQNSKQEPYKTHHKQRSYAPPIKEFRSYAQARQESKQRQA